jgi:hypothetical protein
MSAEQLHDAAQHASIAAYFSAMDDAVLATRGRLVAEMDAPHFVMQCNGGAACILGASASRIVQRRIKALCKVAHDGEKIARACHKVSQLPSHRAYLSIQTSAHRRVPVAVQRTECAQGTHALEVLFFAADDCHPLLISDTVLASVESRSSSQAGSPRQPRLNSLETDLQVCADPYQAEHESLVVLGTASLESTFAGTVASGGKAGESGLDGKLDALQIESALLS